MTTPSPTPAPYWLTGGCPSWCETDHLVWENIDAGLHHTFQDAAVTLATDVGCATAWTETDGTTRRELHACEISAHLNQAHLEGAPRVKVVIDPEGPVSGPHASRVALLTLAEARQLADLLLDLIARTDSTPTG